MQTASHMGSINQLTFGVEIECMLAFPRTKIQAHHTDAEIKQIMVGRDSKFQRERCIRQPLRQAGLQVSSRAEDYKMTYSQWFVKNDVSVDFLEKEFTSPLRCSNGDEIQKYRDMRYCSVEVVSPILPLTIEGLQQVQIAVRTLQKQRLIVPDSAGLHVHIGHGTRGFSLPLLQNLAVLTLCFEQQWNQAHPPSRFFSAHCRSSRKESFQPVGRDRRSMARVMYGLRSVDEFIDKMQTPLAHQHLTTRPIHYLDRGRVVNYMNLRSELSRTIKRTIEFRQHAGTLDEFEILRWIVTVGVVVKVADDRPTATFWNVMRAHVRLDGEDDCAFSLLDLFADFGVEWLKPLWAGHLHAHLARCGADISGDASWRGNNHTPNHQDSDWYHRMAGMEDGKALEPKW